MDFECSLPAMALLFISIALNTIALALPEWSKGHEIDGSLADELAKSDFTAGVWGFCADIELRKNGSSITEYPTISRCFHFHTPSSYNLTKITDQFSNTSEFSGLSVCEAYGNAEAAGDLTLSTFIKMLAYLAGANEIEFGEFLERSCSGVGKASLGFGGISVGTGIFAFILLTVVALRRRFSPVLMAMAIFAIIFAVVSGILVIILWYFQTNMLQDTIDLQGSSSTTMSVVAVMLNAIVVVLLMPDSADVPILATNALCCLCICFE